VGEGSERPLFLPAIFLSTPPDVARRRKMSNAQRLIIMEDFILIFPKDKFVGVFSEQVTNSYMEGSAK
jgi:hypothetical protein